MSKRRYEVEVTGTIFIEVDDEAVSDWDGRTVLQAHENRERWSRDGMTQDDAIGAAALTVGLYGSRDGWADFPDQAIFATTRDFEVESVRELP